MKQFKVNQIYNLDCIDGMKSISDEKIDLVITDPPFAINFKDKKANYNRTSSRVLSGYNEIKAEDYYDFTHAWMSEISRILKKSGSMYVFSGWNNLKDILTALDDIGFTTVNHIIWKYQFGVVTTKKFVTSHYHCIYVCKDNKNVNFFPIQDLKKMQRHLMGEAYTIKTKKMFGILNVNIGLEIIRLPQNFLPKSSKKLFNIQVKKKIWYLILFLVLVRLLWLVR